MAAEVLSKYSSSTLQTQFKVLFGSPLFFFREILGHATGDAMMNDVVVNICGRLVCDVTKNAVMLNSHAFSGDAPPSPEAPRSSGAKRSDGDDVDVDSGAGIASTRTPSSL